MKICIFSDIHGNGPAFNIAYKMIISESADLNIFLGDLCGYYYDQIAIMDLICQIPNLIALKGNHDDIFLRILAGDEKLRMMYRGKYGYSIERLLSGNFTELAKWLAQLPDSRLLSSLDIVCYHASPWDVLEGYVYPDSNFDEFLKYQQSIFFLGHTHYSMISKAGQKIIINPGSLGQPRNNKWPEFAVFEHSSQNIRFMKVVYDKIGLFKQIDKIGDKNPYLKEVLRRGC